MKRGVCTGPWGVAKQPQRARVRLQRAVIVKLKAIAAAVPCSERTLGVSWPGQDRFLYPPPAAMAQPSSQAAAPRPGPGWLADLAGAWVFYSVLPLPPGLQPRFERIARFAPWVGALIGALEAALWLLLAPGGLLAQVALVIAFGVWISGGLHLDGAMDTADGLAAGPERCLEAMDDSRVGASGVQALLQVLLLRLGGLALLGAVAPWALVWAAVWGRLAPLLAMNAFPYLRDQDRGTAAFHRHHWRGLLPELLPALLLLSVLSGLALAVAPGPSAWIGWVGLLPALVVPWRLGRRLGGHSGDSYGACVEWTLSWSLLLMGLLGRLPG